MVGIYGALEVRDVGGKLLAKYPYSIFDESSMTLIGCSVIETISDCFVHVFGDSMPEVPQRKKEIDENGKRSYFFEPIDPTWIPDVRADIGDAILGIN